MITQEDRLVLDGEAISVTLLPHNGADLVSIVDLPTGIDVLFKTPWAGASALATWDTRSRWLAAYEGGWQVLCPNAGEERCSAGAVLGFHGEAAVVPWRVERATSTEAACTTSLLTAPFRMERTIRVERRGVTIEETVENTSPDSHELVWMHHPAFGAPLLSADTVIDLPGGVLTADPSAPEGYLLEAGSVHKWPLAESFNGETVDLRVLPGPDETRALLAGVDQLPAGWFALRNPVVGLGVAMHWDLSVFPHLWLWQEINFSSGFPWFRRAYVVAAEPSNVMTDQRPAEGSIPTLAGGEKRTTTLEMTLFTPSGPVIDVRTGGEVLEGHNGSQQ